jgi:hypothetical protein
MFTHVSAVLCETQCTRSSLPMPAVQRQSVEGAPRRRAAPGSQSVKVAATAATSWLANKPSAHACVVGERSVSALRGKVHVAFKVWRLSVGFGMVGRAGCTVRHSAARPGARRMGISAMRCRASTVSASQASEHNGRMRGNGSAFLRQAPNPSIERTCQGPLRAPWPAAHVER